MAFGFAPPFMSRLGPIQQRAAAALPPPAQAVGSPMGGQGAGSKFPSLPQQAQHGMDTPMQTQTAPAFQTMPGPETSVGPMTTPPAMPVTPPGDASAAMADGSDIGELLAALFGG